MQFVSKPDRFSSDIIIPGKIRDDSGFVRINTTLEGVTGPIVPYLSITGLRLIAQRVPEVGLVPRADLDSLQLAYDQLSELLDSAVEARDALQAKLDRINGLRKDGFQISRIQGRPRKEPTKA